MFLATVAALAAPPDWTRAPPLSVSPRQLLEAAQSATHEEHVTRLLEASSVDVLPGGLAVSRYHAVYAVHTREGADDVGVISARWSPWYENRPEVVARVITADGVEHPLDPANITEQTPSTGATLDDDRALRAPLPAVAPGAVIEELVTVSRHAPYFLHGEVWSFPAHPWWPTVHRRVTVRVASGVEVEWQTAPGFTDRREPGFKVWEIDNIGEKGLFEAWEPDRPPEDRPPAAHLSTATSWQSLARAYRVLVDEALAGVDLGARAASARGDAREPKEIIQRLHASLAEIRYLAVELGATGIHPRSPEIALRNRYGDCKDKALLLVGLLRASGIRANVALIETGPGPRSGQLPGIDNFDHMIVHIPGGDPEWIDPTSDVTPYGRLPWMDQGRHALIIDDGTRALSLTPTEPSDRAVTELTWDVRIDDAGARATIVRTDTGWLGDDAVYGHRDVSTADLDKFYAEKASAWVGGTLAGSVETGHTWDRFTARLEAKDLTRVTREGTAILFSWSGQEVLAWLPEWLSTAPDPADGPRRTPVALASHQARLHMRIAVPEGYVLASMPEPFERRFGSVVWTANGTVADGVVAIDLALDTGDGRLSAAEAEAFRVALIAFGKEPLDVVRFEDAALAAIAAGRPAEGLAIARARALRPDAPTRDVLTYADLLVSHRFRDAALAVVDAQLERDPRSAALWSERGWLHLHDARGNLGAAGLDRPRAIEDLQRAVELDPRDRLAWVRLAIAYERRDDGAFDLSNPDFPRAIDAHLRAWELEKDPEVAKPIAIQLVLHGRLDEAERMLADANHEVAEPLRLGIGLLRGTAPPAGTPVATRRDAYEVAGLSRLFAGDYLAAADLLEQAAAASNRAAEYARSIRGLRAAAPDDRDREDPANVSRLFWRDVVAVGADEAIARWGSKGLRAETKDEPPTDPTHLEFFGVTVPGSVAGHVSSGMLDCATREVDPEAGAAVVCVGAKDLPLWLVHERSGWAVRAIAQYPSVAREALARLQSGDPTAARWLAWASPERPDADLAALLAGHPEIAAALLGARPWSARDDLALLVAGRERLPENLRPRLDRTIAILALEADDEAVAVAAARRILAVSPGDESVHRNFLRAAREHPSPALVAVVREADQIGTGAARAAELVGDFRGASAEYAKLVTAPSASAMLLNNAAWVMLADPDRRAAALELAQRSCERSHFGEINEVHTLALALALNGRPDDAWSLAESKRDAQTEEWEWVYAAIADAWGIPEMADRMLAAAPPATEPTQVTSAWLVSRARARR